MTSLKKNPWIAALNPEEPLLDWLLQETFGQQQAIYIVSHEGIDALFTAFQRMKEIVEPSGELIYFRFYDGSTLNRYLPVLSEGQRREFFPLSPPSLPKKGKTDSSNIRSITMQASIGRRMGKLKRQVSTHSREFKPKNTIPNCRGSSVKSNYSFHCSPIATN